MPVTYHNFGAEEDKMKEMMGLVKSAISNAHGALARVLKQKTLVLMNSKEADVMKKFKDWFGDPAAVADIEEVRGKLRSMDNVLKLGKVLIHYNQNPFPADLTQARDPNPCNTVGENAGAFWWFYNNVTNAYQLKQADRQEAKANEFRIYICPGFWKSAKAKGSLGGVSATGTLRNQSVVGTLVHEISHAAAGTDDEVVGGNKMYGKDNAQTLAQTSPAQARNNAENYGYFCDLFNK